MNFYFEDMLMINTVVWDWNGTLINDVSLNISIMNNLLKEYGLPQINYNQYRSFFCFPVRLFYSKLGFRVTDEIEYTKLVSKFNNSYQNHMMNLNLFKGTKELLIDLKANGIKQILISGLNNKDLQRHVIGNGISDCFDMIIGSNVFDANDKNTIVEKLIESQELNPKETLFVGDTVGDYKIATNNGCECVIVTYGHQNKLTLQGYTSNLIDEITGLYAYLEI